MNWPKADPSKPYAEIEREFGIKGVVRDDLPSGYYNREEPRIEERTELTKKL